MPAVPLSGLDQVHAVDAEARALAERRAGTAERRN
jgi:hypothetical protein